MFFTKNGILIGKYLPIPSPPDVPTAQRLLYNTAELQQHNFFPAISLGHEGGSICVNFGCSRCYCILSGSFGIQLLEPRLPNGELFQELNHDLSTDLDMTYCENHTMTLFLYGKVFKSAH